jgi:hypothetical protein
MSSKKPPPRKMGRPTTIGASTMLVLRLPPSLIEAIDTRAKAATVSRSAAARMLIEAGLKRRPKV